MNAFQIVLAVLFVASCTYTVVGYPAKYGALSGRSRLFRTVGLFLLNLLFGLVLLGTFLDFRANASVRTAAFREIVYWIACIFLALSLMCIALLDWLESLVAYRRAQRDIVYKIVQEETENEKREDGGDKPGSGSSSGAA